MSAYQEKTLGKTRQELISRCCVNASQGKCSLHLRIFMLQFYTRTGSSTVDSMHLWYISLKFSSYVSNCNVSRNPHKVFHPGQKCKDNEPCHTSRYQVFLYSLVKNNQIIIIVRYVHNLHLCVSDWCSHTFYNTKKFFLICFLQILRDDIWDEVKF